MDDIKKALKDAREAINEKKYDEAIKHCKMVLKKNKNNYLGLVFLGVALQDSEQALLAFKKAITIHNDKVLAWQGMASFYERRTGNEDWTELLSIYENLLKYEDDITKLQEVCNKVNDIILTNNYSCGAKILYDNLINCNDSEKKKLLHLDIINLFSNVKFVMNDDIFYIREYIFNNSDDLNDQFVISYLKYLSAIKGFDHMIHIAIEYAKGHNSLTLKEWICKIYSKECILNKTRSTNNVHEVAALGKELLSFNLDSEYGLILKSVVLFLNMDILKSYNLACSLWDSNRQNEILLILMGYCCLKLSRWKKAEDISKMIINHIDKHISISAQTILLISLSSQNDKNKSKEAITLKNTMDVSKFGICEYEALFSANIQIENFEEAEDCLSHLITTDKYISLKAKLLQKTSKKTEAFELLEINKTYFPSCWLPLALHYWHNHDYDKALTPLLQAAKVDPLDYSIFFHLGDYYSICEENKEKAKKCYLKAFTLNPEYSNAGKQLSNIYRSLQNWDANFDFLKNLTNVSGSNDSWSLLELGLHHLALEQWDEAVINLRSYLRFNPNDVEAWESLADSYYSRGSFTSALKCYQRSTQLDNKKQYSLVQIGSIQCLLGQYNDAINTYQTIDDNSFLPALKGMAEVKLSISNDKFTQNLYESSRENAQEAIHLCTQAILKESNFVCLWKILSNSLCIIAKLPTKYRWLYIDPKFSIDFEGDKDILLNGDSIFLLAIRCYCRTINLSTDNCISLYHELAITYLDYYQFCKNPLIAQKAFCAIKKCVQMKNAEWQYWNLMGVICMTNGVKKYSIAQHAFIKALQLDYSNFMVWSNLGILYYSLGHKLLANRALQKAQQFDPTYLQSWIGQALIAESVDHEDAMDLFRHSTQLGFHKESSLGYSEWVCTTLLNSIDKQESKTEYAIKNMHAIPTACDLMTWLNDYEYQNPCCLNIYGILLEKMGLIAKASNTFSEALKYVDEKHKDIVLINYGRTLIRLKNYDLATQIFKSVTEANDHSACGLALSLFKSGNFQESFSSYSTALQWLANSENDKSDLLVAMAGMAYKFQGINDTKTLLFQSVKVNQQRPTMPALLAIYSLGVLHSEQDLANLAINEIIKLSNGHGFPSIKGFLESYLLLKNKDYVAAVRKLSRYLHIYPDNSTLWQYMAKFSLMDICLNPSVASKSSEKAIDLSKTKEDTNENLEMVSLSEILLGNFKKSKIFALKAIHLYPDCIENWALLLTVLTSDRDVVIKHNFLQKTITFVRNHVNLKMSMINWLNSLEHFT